MVAFLELPEQCIPTDHSRQVTIFDMLEDVASPSNAIHTVLDLGCGRGDSVDFFHAKLPHANWTGLDIADSSEVRSRTRTDAKFLTFDGVHIPLADESVDLVFCKQVLQHAQRPEPLLRDVARVLRRDGHFIGSTSQLECQVSRSYWNYTVHGFHALMENAGFNVLQMRPSIDSFTLILRRMVWLRRFDRYWENESPVNRLISMLGRLRGRSHQYINARKLLMAGQFCFHARRA